MKLVVTYNIFFISLIAIILNTSFANSSKADHIKIYNNISNENTTSDEINNNTENSNNSNNINSDVIEQILTNNKCSDISSIVEKLIPSVVQIKAFKINNQAIYTNGNYFDYKELMDLHSIGSGFIISEDGYILTNNHVIENADNISVYLNDTEYNAELIGADEYQDIALLKINSKIKLTPINISNNVEYKVGDNIIVMGNPYGLGISVTSGIISATNRHIKEIELGNLIQIDAPVNKGNSGGPLLDCNGNLIGINTISYFDITDKNNTIKNSIGFAIPINTVLNTVDKLKEFGYIQYGWLGINGNNIDNDIFKILNSKRKTGIFVLDVVKNSPADKAGILVGDIIISYAGKHVTTFNQLLSLIRGSTVGSGVDILVLRNNKYIKLRATIVDSSENNKYNNIDEKIRLNSVEFMDMIITKIDDNFTEKYEVYNNRHGMYVIDVKKGGLADYYGIEIGDIILTINQFQLTNKNNYLSAIDNLKLNGNKNFFMIIKKKKNKENIVLKLNFNLINQ
ncbi:MAG: trypsin-like peptidase domain-containing protein [Rickettsiales bacterium]|nr:trypsin-like peptidase domain-containing protein [Rickettsiales bacterium]